MKIKLFKYKGKNVFQMTKLQQFTFCSLFLVIIDEMHILTDKTHIF